MTREEKINTLKAIIQECEDYQWQRKETLFEIVKALEQEPCEVIKEIPKDYKYDTETEDFLVYRHMYTGHEIHIEKSVPKYRLEQEPCEDAISRKAVLDLVVANHTELNGVNVVMYSPLCKDIKQLSPVNPQTNVLNKIKAETEQIEINGHIRDVECFRTGINTVLNIIEKYRREQV